jgi:uncharacterized protein with PIN domain
MGAIKMKCNTCNSDLIKDRLPKAESTPGSNRKPQYVNYWYCEKCRVLKKRIGKV